MESEEVMSYHGKMMNVLTDRPTGDPTNSHYLVGHRDARHACAEIAAEADAEIQRLKETFGRHEESGEEMTCEWTYDEHTCSWDTECGNKHVFMEGTPVDNSYEFCPYCGERLEEEARKK